MASSRKQEKLSDNTDNQIKDEPLTTIQFLALIKSNEYKETIREINKPIVDLLTKEIQMMKGIIHKQHSEIQECHRVIAQQERRIKKIENEVHRKERNTRLRNLKVSGLTGTTAEECKTNFINLVKTNIDVTLAPEEFEVNLPPTQDPTPAEAAGQTTGPERKKPIMLTFNNDWKRRSIYAKRVRVGRNVFLSEDLNKEESSLYFQCRKAKREGKIKSTWTMNHKIFILTFKDEKTEIENKELLDLVIGGQWDRRDSFTMFSDMDPGSQTFLGFGPADLTSSPISRGSSHESTSLMESFLSTSTSP